jgi:hypothetical protein
MLRMRIIASHVRRYVTNMQARFCSRRLAYRGQPCTWSRVLHLLQTIEVKLWESVRPSKQDSMSQRNSTLSAGPDLLVAIDDVKESAHVTAASPRVIPAQTCSPSRLQDQQRLTRQPPYPLAIYTL